jgi:hypothetical protein
MNEPFGASSQRHGFRAEGEEKRLIGKPQRQAGKAPGTISYLARTYRIKIFVIQSLELSSFQGDEV